MRHWIKDLLVIATFQDLFQIQHNDTRSCIQVGDLKIMISTAGSGPSSVSKLSVLMLLQNSIMRYDIAIKRAELPVVSPSHLSPLHSDFWKTLIVALNRQIVWYGR